MSHKLLLRKILEFVDRRPQTLPLWLMAHSIVVELRGIESQSCTVEQLQFFDGLGWVSVDKQVLKLGLTKIILDNSQPYRLQVFPVGKTQSIEISLWINRLEMSSTWRAITDVAVGSAWQWTAPILGSWFQLEISPSIATSIEVAQGDGSIIIGEVTTIETFPQIVYLPLPSDLLLPNQRKLTFRTSGSVTIQQGWIVRVLVPVAEIPQPIEQQILALLQQQVSAIDGGTLL